MKRFFKYPWIIVGVIAASTAFFALQLPKAVLDNNTFRFMPEGNPARVAQQRIDEQYGSQINILVGLKRRYGTVLEPEFLLKLQEFSKAAGELPRVDTVTSMMSVDYITGDTESITVEPLVPETFSGTREEIRALKERLLDWDLYSRAMVSDDLRSTQVLVSIAGKSDQAGDSDTVKLYGQLKDLAAKTGFPSSDIYVTGMPAFTSVMNAAMRSDLLVLIPLVGIVVLGILFLSFRKAGGVVLPMLTVAVSTIWSIGLMALLGVKLSMLATVLPVILVAVGSAYGIHIVSHYYDEMAGKRNLSDDDHRAIIFHVMKRIGAPVLLAALTTFAGFVSLAFTSVVPIQEFGIFSSFGVIVAFAVAVTMIPSLLIIRGPQKTMRAMGKNGKARAMTEETLEAMDEKAESDAHLEGDRISSSIANLFGHVTSKPRTVFVATLLLIGLSVFGVFRLKIDNIIINYFKGDTDIVRSDVFIRNDFAGSKTVSVIVRGDEKGSMTDPRILKAMDDLGIYLEAEFPEVGKVTGFHHLIKRINQVFNSGESPDGLAAVSSAPPEAPGGEGAFGDWGSDSEPAFGDWGAADTGTGGSAPSTAVAAPMADPAIGRLQAVALLSRALSESRGSTVSAAELVKSLQRETNYRGASYYEIPSDPERYGKQDVQGLKNLIGNYLVLLSGDMTSWADDPLAPREARMNIQLRTIGQEDTMRVVSAIKKYTAENFPTDYSVEIGGVAMVEQALNELVVNSQLISIFSSLFLVFLILAVYYKSFAAGLIGIFTLGLTVLVNFAVMGYLGIRLNIGTALVGSIAVGTGIDYIIHYLAAYKHETLKQADSARVLRRTFLTSGKAILFNAVSVGAGFAVLAMSQFNMLVYLGVLIAAAMLVSSIVSLTVLPVILDWFKPKFLRKVQR